MPGLLAGTRQSNTRREAAKPVCFQGALGAVEPACCLIEVEGSRREDHRVQLLSLLTSHLQSRIDVHDGDLLDLASTHLAKMSLLGEETKPVILCESWPSTEVTVIISVQMLRRRRHCIQRLHFWRDVSKKTYLVVKFKTTVASRHILSIGKTRCGYFALVQVAFK